ncbi:EF-hand calcium-binding domain-containing protein 14 isoform X1 [Strongylocentrotus purpuratus]|uniref:Uncharacterized protein n=2 Tax=Strongylocentrotus purpuratus TaxID=7668 RepID=A0A7M7NGA5_STRPU|nr:EF-hand calcium-binding domain-containing protein 14 isoform X1 [Strongylocentrotus purpuratus]XP_030836021.1 EF-hand calcium-binding domain-containing protein 14 isoform X1 [Strongylocentrotus purpuratus]
MKKRKELDALLTMPNGKKNGKSKRSKEGHELLRLDSESNSSDNEELFLAPKKTVIRRPKPCQCCTMCVPLVMFILTMGCMVITGGLIWMHFNLKQDLDNLRRSLEKVEIKADSASSQQKTILSLESGLDKLSHLPEKVDVADIKINILNKSLSAVQTKQDELDSLKARIAVLEGKTSSASVAELQQNVAELGSEVEDLKGKHETQDAKVSDNEQKITEYEQRITELSNEVDTLKNQITLLQNPPTTPPSPEVAPPTSASSATTKHPPATEPSTGSASSGPNPQLIEVKEDITRIWAAVHEVQSTATNLSREHEEVVASLTQLRKTLLNGTATSPPLLPTVAGHSSSAPQGLQASQFDLAQMKVDIELLKDEYNRSIASMPVTDIIPIEDLPNFNATWLQSLTDRIGRLEEKVKELKPVDGNPNLLNVNVTNSMQMLLERSLAQFKNDNFADVSTLQSDVETLQQEIAGANSFDNEVGTRITAIQDQISNLKRECSACTPAEGGPLPVNNPTVTTGSTESPSSTTASERTADGSS